MVQALDQGPTTSDVGKTNAVADRCQKTTQRQAIGCSVQDHCPDTDIALGSATDSASSRKHGSRVVGQNPGQGSVRPGTSLRQIGCRRRAYRNVVQKQQHNLIHGPPSVHIEVMRATRNDIDPAARRQIRKQRCATASDQ